MYLLHPHVCRDLITFVAAGDVWLAPTTGGRAWRLSSDQSSPHYPRFSPDGRHVAWTALRDGNVEVIVAAVDDGEARRLTWMASRLGRVVEWADNDHILFASNAGSTEVREMNLHSVDLDRRVTCHHLGSVGELATHPDGARALSTYNGRSPAMWKRYRGGTASRLWLDRGDGQWQRVLRDETAALVNPLWVGDTLCFVSDRGSAWPGADTDQANLWALDVLNGQTQPRQITHHSVEDGYVRDASTDGERIVYSCRGELYLLDSLEATPQKITVELPGVTHPREELDPLALLTSVIPIGAGHASIVTTRGRAYRLGHIDGPARALVAESGVRAQWAQPLGNDGSVVMVTDHGGDDGLFVIPADGEPYRMGTGELGTVLHLQAAPDGIHAATISHDGWVRLHNLAERTTRDLRRGEQGEPTGLCFSPDSRHLVWSEPTFDGSFNRLVYASLEDDGVHELTAGRFTDTSPTFTADGQHLAFLSNRTFEPVYDSHSFDLNFASATRPWLVPLRATDPAPFGVSVDGRQPVKKSDSDEDRVVVTEIDVPGFEQRMVPLPVPSGDYRDLSATTAGLVWIHEKSDRGVLAARLAGTDTHEHDILEHFTFATRRLDVLADQVDSYAVSQDLERLVLVADSTVTARPATRTVEDKDPELVTIDLSRISGSIDLRAEWLQMFDENHRIMHRHFWREDMDGVDWEQVAARYRPLVAEVTTHDEFVDLLWETVGELNTSHAYVTPAVNDNVKTLGQLGVDLTATDEGWRIDRILAGESSDPDARAPLMGPGVAAQPGDVIVAVNGEKCLPPVPPAAHLVGLADKPVELTVRRDGKDRRVAVIPLKSEQDLRYQDWVASRRAHVAERSSGRLGYLHVPDMQARGWAQFHRDIQGATAREGVIVDVRYNRGGHTSQLVLERLARRPIAWSMARHLRNVDPYPAMAPLGPVVLVANQYSGSDGDIVNANAQQMGLGPVIGVRTWGGVVGIDGRFTLVDGTSVTQPRYAFVFNDRGWSVEGHGVDPDIEVEMAPGDVAAGRDAQLDRAIDEALAQLADTPAATPPAMMQPRVRR